MTNEMVVKNWIRNEYKEVAKGNRDIKAGIDRCYGVIMFACNALYDTYNEDLGNWWDDEMLPKFRALY